MYNFTNVLRISFIKSLLLSNLKGIIRSIYNQQQNMYAYQPFPERQNSISNEKSEAKVLVAFDFDHTIVDDNTDDVARKLVPKSSLTTAEEVYKSTDSWTLYMREIFCCLHKLNVSKEQIITAIQKIPAIKGMDRLLKNLCHERFEVIVISDSNSVFINEWIKTNQLENTVRKVVTNPAWFDSSGRLNIEFYQNQTFCDLSEPNLCKGYVLQTYESDRKIENVVFDHIVYIGDGSNDLCPVLKLSEKDLAFPRLNYSLFKKIKKNENLVKAQVYPWVDGTDVIKVFEEKFGIKFSE